MVAQKVRSTGSFGRDISDRRLAPFDVSLVLIDRGQVYTLESLASPLSSLTLRGERHVPCTSLNSVTDTGSYQWC